MADSRGSNFRVVIPPAVQKGFERIAKKDAALHERIEEQLVKISKEPELGKPLRYGLKSQRRLHIGSFVILYEIHGDEVWVIDFDHHDRIYKRYRLR